MRATWVAVMLSCACGCAPRQDAFACASDQQCVDGSNRGVCEGSGYCSFPDLECDSDRRYGPLAPADLAGKCVPHDEGTGEASTSTSTTSTTTPPLPTTSADASSPTVDPETSSTSSGPITDTMPTPACDYVDDFEDGMIGNEWESFDEPGCPVVEKDGVFSIVFEPNEDNCEAGIVQAERNLLGTTLRARFAPITGDVDEDLVVWLSAGDPDVCSLEIGIAGNHAAGFSVLDFLDGGEIDITQPVWMQLRIEADGYVYWEVDKEGSWLAFHEEESPCDLSDNTHQLWAATDVAFGSEVVRGIEEFTRCAP